MPILVKFGKDLVKFGLEEASLRLFLPDCQEVPPDSPAVTGQSARPYRTVWWKGLLWALPSDSSVQDTGQSGNHWTVRQKPPDSPVGSGRLPFSRFLSVSVGVSVGITGMSGGRGEDWTVSIVILTEALVG